MKKKKVKLTDPWHVHIELPIVGRMAGYKFHLPDETDDVADWAKETARKIIETPNRIKGIINTIIKSTPRTIGVDFAIGKDVTGRLEFDINGDVIKKEIIK